jgi:glycosyltransferase involved in cell wall biosynthesis
VKLCLIPSDRDGPGSYRLLFPASYLEKAGFEILFPPYVVRPNGIIDFQPYWPQADVYVIQRRMERTVAERIVPALQRKGHKVVLEADDDDFNHPSWHPAHEATHPASNPEVNRHWLRETAKQADAVSVSTPYLAKTYLRFNNNVHVLPNYLKWEMWEERKPVYEHRPWKRLRIGWMGDPKLRRGDLSVLRGLIGPWLHNHPEVDFASAGSESTHEVLEIPPAQRVTLPGIPFHEDRLHELLQFDIGLIPLDSCPFNEAKSHLKGMEYAALGIPTIASETASYRDWYGDGGIGFTVRRPKEWTRALDRLCAEPDLRRRMGIAARARARENSLDKHWRGWLEFYETLRDRGDDRTPDVGTGALLDQAAA